MAIPRMYRTLEDSIMHVKGFPLTKSILLPSRVLDRSVHVIIDLVPLPNFFD